jgi:hypothetical protein
MTADPQPADRRRRDRRRAVATGLAVAAVVLALPLLAKGYGELRGHRGVDQVALLFAGGREAACRVVQPGAAGCPVPGAEAERYASAVRADWYLVAGYVLAGLGVFGLGALFLYGSGARRVARWCLGGVLLAGAADSLENLPLLRGLDSLGGDGGDTAFRLAACLGVLKFAVGGPLLPVFVVVASVLAARRAHRPSRVVRREDASLPEIARASELDPGTTRRPDIILPPAVADSSTATLSATVGQSGPDVQQELYTDEGRARAAREAATVGGPDADLPGPARARWQNAGRVPPGRPPAEVGICASGGGIRSASVTLGALQALQRDILPKARYLVSVSGGGYMTGAFQLALTRANPEAESLATPADVFTPGSAEEDHLRRHGKYLADGGREWASALGVVLRGVAASLALLTLGVVVVGVGLNAFYRAAPVVDVTRLLPRFDPAAGPDPAPFPSPAAAVWWTLGVGAAVAVAAWVVVMVGLLASNDRLGLALAARNLFRAAVGVSGAVAVYAVAVPVVVWAMARLSWAIPVESPVPAASFTAVATTLLTWFGALASTMWRRTERLAASGARVGPLRGVFGGKGGGEVVEQQVATGLGQRLIVWAVHAVLAFVFLFVAAWTTAAAHRWPAWLDLALLGALVGAGFLIDQTWLSLHPFYRRRLASAFAVRRAHMPDGGTGALAYEIEEPTTLSTYGGRRDGFPQVIFVGAAALSGQSRTPPGRRSAAFTMSADYVGGPDLGWVRTSTLEETCKPALRRDVTVQAAMAVSGAAIASAMGRHAAAVQRLLALSNVRLGTWLPNPAFLAVLGRPKVSWRTPRLPNARRLPYQLREIIGAYPAEGRMLLCTDGGHWENLGLVELLRHRCRTVYCIDASGDSPPFATTLAEAITLAYEELGVRITLRDTAGLVPGSAAPLSPPQVLERLNARLSRTAVALADIEYPEPFTVSEGESPSRHGALIVAKALLTPDMPYELLTYALKETAFPRQSTGDQFFDHAQFDAYRALGHHIGTAALAASKPPTP